MDSGFYAACAGLVARTQSLDLAANNLANASTTGYRAQQETFRQVVAGKISTGALNRAVNSYGVLGSPQTDFAQGTLQKTGNPLDFGIEGNAFFTVQTAAGIRYSRDGNFRLSSDRTLLTTAGDRVLGDQGPIRVDACGRRSPEPNAPQRVFSHQADHRRTSASMRPGAAHAAGHFGTSKFRSKFQYGHYPGVSCNWDFV